MLDFLSIFLFIATFVTIMLIAKYGIVVTNTKPQSFNIYQRYKRHEWYQLLMCTSDKCWMNKHDHILAKYGTYVIVVDPKTVRLVRVETHHIEGGWEFTTEEELYTILHYVVEDLLSVEMGARIHLGDHLCKEKGWWKK